MVTNNNYNLSSDFIFFKYSIIQCKKIVVLQIIQILLHKFYKQVCNQIIEK